MLMLQDWLRKAAVGGVLTCITSMGAAQTSLMNTNTTLARIQALLSQTYPLINLAEKQEPQTSRIHFQFDTLRHDIAQIQTGIAKATTRIDLIPRIVKPLAGDYLKNPNSPQKSTHQEENP